MVIPQCVHGLIEQPRRPVAAEDNLDAVQVPPDAASVAGFPGRVRRPAPATRRQGAGTP